MNELFKLLLKMSISGSIFFTVFYILIFFTQKVFSGKWHLRLIKINMIFYVVPIVSFYDFFTKDLKDKSRLEEVLLSLLQLLIGILNPTIIFPRNIECSYKLEPVIIHELTHYKRKDLLFKTIQLWIVTINWFNPIVYVMNNLFEKWCEISCDEIVA